MDTRQSFVLPVTLLLIVSLALLASGIAPYDRLTWWLEVAPVLIVMPLLLLSWQRFPLTPLLYWLIAIHCLILILGAHYTYARVPLGFWVQEAFDLARNHYDRLGHLAQGFIPAMAAREILTRRQVVNGTVWRFVFVTCICLAFSAFYEMIEWWSALLAGDGAIEFLGTQGDPWDTQWDMFLALTGAISAQLLLGPWHDRQMAALATGP
ncbi:MAG: DUF2238 domain-containing protein [Gammaproteobacteria bacterium]|nr:MAG: DUF2238 domain-containing protein [Gammaproteobacteria bacterium]